MKRIVIVVAVLVLAVTAYVVSEKDAGNTALNAKPAPRADLQHAIPATAKEITFDCRSENENACDYFWATFQEDAGMMKDPTALRIYHVTLDVGCVDFSADRCSREKAVVGLLSADGTPISVTEVGLDSSLIATVAHKAADAAYGKKEKTPY